MSNIYLHGIAGYYSDLLVYETRAAILRDAGFVRLRSAPDDEEKYWEVWALFGRWQAKGPLAGATDDAIERWCLKTGAGQVECRGTVWGLSPG